MKNEQKKEPLARMDKPADSIDIRTASAAGVLPTLYGVAVNKDDSVRVVSVPVKRETSKSYFTERPAWDVSSAFGMNWVTRRGKSEFRLFLSADAALDAYMRQRQQDKADANAVVAQATKQIASANELRQAIAKAEGR